MTEFILFGCLAGLSIFALMPTSLDGKITGTRTDLSIRGVANRTCC